MAWAMISWRMTFLNWFIAASQDLDTLGHTASDLPTTCWSRPWNLNCAVKPMSRWSDEGHLSVHELNESKATLSISSLKHRTAMTLSTWGNGWFNESLGSLSVWLNCRCSAFQHRSAGIIIPGLTGEPDGAPMKTGLSLFDLTAGLHGVAFSEFVDEVFSLTFTSKVWV